MDFSSWYRAHHGYDAFPWQRALALRVADGDWPDAITAPTGAGKTAVVAVWLWALEEGLPVPRRLVYVVDRRLIVDSTALYATRLASESALQPAVVAMRGGIVIDDAWLDPHRPAVIISTVDQAGSRLLFSGYGVSERAAPIHAALLGNDALWVLDEVHLAQPLLRTLNQVQQLRGSALPLPFRVVVMSATWSGDRRLGLGPDDLLDPKLAPRLNRPKPFKLREIDADADLVHVLIQEAKALRRQGAEVIAVIVNTVRDARAVFNLLSAEAETILLTGRVRPAERDALVAEYLERMASGTRCSGRAPLYVVATQTIEVGADLDFDALVSESAPLSALLQRAGRLNRLGELESAPMVVIHRALSDKEKMRRRNEITRRARSHHSLYREQANDACKWMNKNKVKDFGSQAMERHPALAEPETPAPDLLAAHLDLLSWTSVRHGIDPAPWLHGYVEPDRTVFLCWRRDADAQTLALMPPVQQEILEITLWELRGMDDRQILRWDGTLAEPITLDQARVGDTLILDASAGGCDRFGWNPQSREPVVDLGDTPRRMRIGGPEGSDWRALALDAGMERPGRVLAYPGGALVLAATEWTSDAAIRPIRLAQHLPAVATRALHMARAAGLPAVLCEAARRSGAGHDVGKLEPRWQARVGADPDTPLAKGPGGDDPWLVLPRGWRHEMASAVRIRTDPLVRHLIGSHHGSGRPVFPAAPDVALWRRLEGWAGQFDALQRRYGWWGLAYLEALVRLADWQISNEEQRHETQGIAA